MLWNAILEESWKSLSGFNCKSAELTIIRASQMNKRRVCASPEERRSRSAGILTERLTASSQLRDSAGFAPDFPRFLQRLLLVGTDACVQ